ncbi:NAD(P)/FAD-dependent oxidoreductase [Candidatus Synechococcus spongiarum]|uniref:NADH dehydrogenase n=1 Tax=Candidatus Synechococcus spongiarum TaxID=431041 RepID=A0A171DHL2_9SYNE|nr:FAD-dependent oxidoreductase [Candidatus Synechococcus spongiarum]SAY39299.1 NADH dehydrogenase (EC 1.6.99.3) [Candidatus Synechococcus spongiarum]
MQSSHGGQFRVVVVGGGFAGLTTALALAHKRSSVSVVLVEPQDHFLFTPLLYELLSGELQTWQVAPKLEHLLAGHGIAWLQDRVTSINRQTRCLTTSSGRNLSFDRLVLTCGGVLQSFGVEGVTDHAVGFRTMADLRRLQHLVQRLQTTRPQPLQRLAIVGAGASGVELACKLADLLVGKSLIELIEQGDKILPGSREFNRQQALTALQQRDVSLRCRSRVQGVAADHLTLLVQGETETLPCAGVIWTAGLAVAPPLLLPSAPVGPQGQLICQADLRLAGEEAVFAAGDVAAVPDKRRQQPPPATAQVAMQQAPVLAHNVLASLDGEPLQDFHWNDLGEILSLGRGQATITAKGFTMAGPTAARLREVTYLVRMPGAGHRLAAAVGWLGEHLGP